ncbi:DUF6906 family protein [Peribacillus aracenensis]|uniref:DUF6906 family protein n=1 Tax=Peribacillus aracenensis TaxID=2976708 RepID=UPI0037C6C976
MKNGKRLTRKQKELIQEAKLNPSDWLIAKNLPNELHLVHRECSKTTKVISC